jgi:hypothetical protein
VSTTEELLGRKSSGSAPTQATEFLLIFIAHWKIIFVHLVSKKGHVAVSIAVHITVMFRIPLRLSDMAVPTVLVRYVTRDFTD